MAKVDSSDQNDDEGTVETKVKKIKQLEEEIKASKKNLNNIPVLIDMCEAHIQEKPLSSRLVTSSILALCRIFSRLMIEDSNFVEIKTETKPSDSKKTEKSSKDIFVDWMSSNYKRFTRLLLLAVQKDDEALQEENFHVNSLSYCI